jgi:histone-lysine N-methyltransferase SETDB1
LFEFILIFYIKFHILGGRKLSNEAQVDNYLHETKSKLSIEFFVFDSTVNIRQSYSSDGRILSSDISNGQENVPIPAVNEVDDDKPTAFTYRVERTPVEGVNMVTNEPTMTCCSCTDGCRNRVRCACKYF